MIGRTLRNPRRKRKFQLGMKAIKTKNLKALIADADSGYSFSRGYESLKKLRQRYSK